MSKNLPDYLIAIGACAESLNEINDFFNLTTLEDVSYIIIPHLPADYKIQLEELLISRGKLQIKKVMDGMSIQCNKVYLAPDNCQMTLRQDKFFISPLAEDIPHDVIVNLFFESLASNSYEKAIGIILSDLGTAVYAGIQAIRNRAGKVISGHNAVSVIEKIKEQFSHDFIFDLKGFFSDPEAFKSTVDKVLSDQQITHTADYLVLFVNKDLQVLKYQGNINKYLLPKLFSTNLSELLPRSLNIAFQNMSRKVINSKKKAGITGISINYNGVPVDMDLSIIPLFSAEIDSSLFIIILHESSALEENKPDQVLYNELDELNQYTINLEEELHKVKYELQVAKEKLKNSEENLHSFNEELFSVNEELQSINEETESLNEELNIVNKRYQFNNKELQELNEDLNNYFKSNINGQLFVDGNMRLLKFSPNTAKLINLIDEDIGRPLSHITTNIKFNTIIEDLYTVLSNHSVLCKEIETNDGRWYQVLSMPYLRESGSQKTGAILTFSDITKLKRAQRILFKKNESLCRINEDLEHFVFAASHDLLAPLGNIQASIEMMNQIPLGDETILEFTEIINQSITKFSQLIRDIAVIAKLESQI